MRTHVLRRVLSQVEGKGKRKGGEARMSSLRLLHTIQRRAPGVNVPRKWRKNEEEISPFPPSLRSAPNLIVRLVPVLLSSTQPVLLSLPLVFRLWDQDKKEGARCFCSGRVLCREGCQKRGSFIYILFVVSRLFPDLGGIPREAARKKDVEYRVISGRAWH